MVIYFHSFYMVQYLDLCLELIIIDCIGGVMVSIGGRLWVKPKTLKLVFVASR